jgi:huntingtin
MEDRPVETRTKSTFSIAKLYSSLFRKKDQPVGKKEKASNCNTVADCICAANLRLLADFPKFLGIAMETFLMLCDDPESDVRMVADECLNRTIKVHV